LGVGKSQYLPSRIWQTLGNALNFNSFLGWVSSIFIFILILAEDIGYNGMDGRASLKAGEVKWFMVKSSHFLPHYLLMKQNI